MIEHVICEATSNDNFTVLYFFCQYDEPQSLTGSTILRSLLRQFLAKGDLAPNKEAKLDQFQRYHWGLDVTRLAEIFEQAMKSMSKYVIVLDGIDDCPEKERSNLLRHLRVLVLSGNYDIRLLISSRLELDIDLLLNDFPRTSMSASNISADIATYIDASIKENLECGNLSVGDNTILPEVRQALIDGADGMYVFFLFREILHCEPELKSWCE